MEHKLKSILRHIDNEGLYSLDDLDYTDEEKLAALEAYARERKANVSDLEDYGYWLGESGDHKRVNQVFGILHRYDPGNEEYRNKVIQSLFHMGKSDEGYAMCIESEYKEPIWRSEMLHFRSVWLIENGRIDEARDCVERALNLNPENVEGYHGKGFLYYLEGNYEKALELYDKTIELSPSHAYARYNKACIYSILGDHDQALANLESAFKHDPRCISDAEEDEELLSLRRTKQYYQLIERYKNQ